MHKTGRVRPMQKNKQHGHTLLRMWRFWSFFSKWTISHPFTPTKPLDHPQGVSVHGSLTDALPRGCPWVVQPALRTSVPSLWSTSSEIWCTRFRRYIWQGDPGVLCGAGRWTPSTLYGAVTLRKVLAILAIAAFLASPLAASRLRPRGQNDRGAWGVDRHWPRRLHHEHVPHVLTSVGPSSCVCLAVVGDASQLGPSRRVSKLLYGSEWGGLWRFSSTAAIPSLCTGRLRPLTSCHRNAHWRRHSAGLSTDWQTVVIGGVACGGRGRVEWQGSWRAGQSFHIRRGRGHGHVALVVAWLYRGSPQLGCCCVVWWLHCKRQDSER